MIHGKSHLLINEPAIQVLPSLVLAIGLEEAMVLQQLHYWLDNPKNTGRIDETGEKWIFNTYEEWKETNFPFWSTTKIQRIFLSLEKMGVVISAQFDAKKYDKRKFYRIDYDVLANIENGICMVDSSDLQLSNEAELLPSEVADLDHVNNELTKNNAKTTSEDTEKENSATTDGKINHYKNNSKTNHSESDQNVYRIYEANIGALTPIIANRLDMDVEDYSFEWVEKAIELAVTNEARNLVYVEAILARWKKDGFGVDKRQPKQTKRVQIDPYGNRVEL